jgi:hypothetical protein
MAQVVIEAIYALPDNTLIVRNSPTGVYVLASLTAIFNLTEIQICSLGAMLDPDLRDEGSNFQQRGHQSRCP